MREQSEAAIARGLREIAFTEHEDYNTGDSTAFFFRHDAYFEEMTRCRAAIGERLVIRAGIEISEPHVHGAKAAAVIAAHPWDVVLGSLHWMAGGINTYLEDFWTFAGDWRESFRRYFTELAVLARVADYDVLAHIDYPARYHRDRHGDGYDISGFEAWIRPVLAHVIARGKAIEINTSAWRKGLPDPNPPGVVIQWYREMGGEHLTLGSDAHAPADVGAGLARAAAIARDAGFKELTTFSQRRAIRAPLNV